MLDRFRNPRFVIMRVVAVILFACLLCYFLSPAFLKKENVFSPGQIIRGKPGEDYRIFIQLDNDGYYVIQDFYRDGPLTNPYRVKDRDDLYKDYSEQVSIDGLFVHYFHKFCDVCGMKFDNYRNGVKNEVLFSTFNDGSDMEQMRRFVGGGEFVAYYPNGNRYVKGKIEKDGNNGKMSIWWRSGAKKGEMEVKDNQLKVVVWYKNGAKKREGIGEVGNVHWTTWYENGQVSSKVSVVDSVPVKCSEYGGNGEILYEDIASRAICGEMVDKEYFHEEIELDEIPKVIPMGSDDI